MTIASVAIPWPLRALRRLRPRHCRLLLPALVVCLSDLLFRQRQRTVDPPAPAPPLDWGRGISVVVPHRGDVGMLGDCLRAARDALSAIDEPGEIIVVFNGGRDDDLARLRDEHPGLHWLRFAEPLGFTRAILEGLAHARFGGVYLLNNDMLLDADALRATLPWRSGHVFGIATQIFMEGEDRRREETGWTAMAFEGAAPRPRHLTPSDDAARGTVWAGAGAALYNAALLRTLLPSCLAYDPFYWEDVDLGVRAWRAGYVSLFCPRSRAWHGHRVTIRRFYAAHEIARIFERNRLLFLLRNPFPRHGLKATLVELGKCDSRSAREIAGWRSMAALWRARWAAFRSPWRDVDYASMSSRRMSEQPRPCVLLVSPFAILPPRHGGAVRTHRLAAALATDYDVALLTDEAESYGDLSDANCAPFVAVHLVRGRPAEQQNTAARIARIRSHSHAAMHRALALLVAEVAPVAVVVEHVELAGLIETRRAGGPAYLLSLHDVLLSPHDPREAAADAFERRLIDRFDVVVVSSPEDQQLLEPCASVLVENGVDVPGDGAYAPSTGSRSILFVGPFRAPNNWEGIVAFVERAYPLLRARVPDVSLTVVGGGGAVARAAACAAFRHPSIQVLERVDDLASLYRRCALTINPQRQLRGSSLKVLESLAQGRMCVTTAVGARGRAADGFRGLVVVEDVIDFVEPLAQLLASDDERVARERPERGKLARYDWSTLGARLRVQVGGSHRGAAA